MRPERRHEVSRIEGFSDAAFAFALTLLVVSLEVPRSYDELIRIMRGFPSFACCFALLIWIWYEHNVFFRRYGLQDGWTVVMNGVLLFVTLFYVYPLKFMFDSMFGWLGAVPNLVPMDLAEMARASAIYAFGFVVLFTVFTLLYRHVYNQRERLGLTPAEVLDIKIFAGHHLVSVGVGLVALAIATLAPVYMSPLSPTAFMLMGPAHFGFGWWSARWRHGMAES